MNTDELNAIRAKIYGGCTIRRIDVKDLLSEIDQLTKDNAELTAKVDRLTETNKALESDNYNAELNLSLMTARAERAEKEKGCEYCKVLTPDHCRGFFLPSIDPDCESDMVTIKYCPMCGNELEVEHEKSKPPFEMKCNKCGKPQVPNKEKSNHNWIVFDANQLCECGGKFVPWVGGKPISEAKQDG